MAIKFLNNQSIAGDLSLDTTIEFGTGLAAGENYATLKMVGQGLQVSVGDPANTTNPLVDFDGAYGRVLIGSTTVADTPYLRVGGAGNQSSKIELTETTTGVGKVMNYGFSFNQTGNTSNTLEIKRHSNSTTGSTVITLARDNSNVTLAEDLTVSGGEIILGGTGRIQGIDIVSASTDAANKAYVDAHGGGVGPFLPLSAGSSYPLTGVLYAGQGVKFTGGTIAAATTVLHTNNVVYTRGGSGGLFLQNEDGSDGIFISNDSVRFDTGSAEKMRITSAGNVGIGTTSPSQKLEVIGRTKITQSGDALRINSSDANGSYASWQNNGSNIGYIGAGYHLWSSPNNIATSLGIRAQTRLDLGIQASVHMTILNSGNVGIGTTSPSEKLDVVGSIKTTDKVKFYSSTSHYGSIYADSEGLNLDTVANRHMIFKKANVEVMRISTSGNVGIGTTSPGAKLEINTNALSAIMLRARYNSGYYTDYGSNQIDFTGSNQSFGIKNNGSFAMFINSSSNVGIGTTSPASKLDVQGGMSQFSTTLTNNEDWENSPISINERGQVGNSQTADKYAPNLNFHWAGRSSKSLWLGATGQLNFGEYSAAGVPVSPADGRINAATFAGDLNGTINTATTGTTQTAGNNSTKIATTAYVDASVPSLTNYVTLNTAQTITGAKTFNNDVTLNNTYLLGVDKLEANQIVIGTSTSSILGNVGIGTTSPETPLHVLSNTTDNASTMLIQNGSTGDASIKFNVSGDTYSIGIDNSDGDKFKLSYGAVGTNDRIVVDTLGNVGIGTTTPYGKLDVAGNIRLRSANQIYFGGAAQIPYWTAGVDNTTNNNFVIGGSSYYSGDRDILLTPSGSGNVGIGTTSPLEKLEVEGTVYATPVTYAANRNAYGLKIGASNNTAFDMGIKIKSTSSGAAYMSLCSHSTEDLIILKGANVGIKTDNPSWDLDVAGDIRIRDQGKLYFGNSGSIPFLEIYSDTSNNMVIGDVYTNNADVLFNIQGNIGMGNTTPAAKLDIVNTSGTTSSGLLKLKSTTVFSSAPGHMIDFIRSNNTIRGFVGMNQYGVTYSTSSDYRLKRNIVPIADSIDRIKKLKPSRFNWDDGPDDYVVDGFIAHEVADVIPEAITGEKDDVDKDNAPIYQSIDQSKIVPLLTAALQEAVAKIEALELRINKLEKQ